MSRWGPMASEAQLQEAAKRESGEPEEAPVKKRKRKSRWAAPEESLMLPGMPTVMPSGLNETQEQQYILQLKIEEISRKLRSGDLGIPARPEDRSPSPEPIYNNEGKRMNTREYRTRKNLEEKRHDLVQELQEMNSDYKPPPDYRPPLIRVTDKVFIPQDDHPDINFIGLLIGPRGNTLRQLEKDTGAKIIIRGKGSVKEGKIRPRDGQPMPGEDEPLHAYVTAQQTEHVAKAVKKITEIIKEGIEVPDGQSELRRQQMRDLALLNGTLRENDGLAKLKQLAEAQEIVTNTIVCSLCGGAGHIAQDCKNRRPGFGGTLAQPSLATSSVEKARMDSEYMSLMAELGEAPPDGIKKGTVAPPTRPVYSQPPPQQTPPMMGMNRAPPPNFQSPPPQLPPQQQQHRPPWQQPQSMPQANPPRPSGFANPPWVPPNVGAQAPAPYLSPQFQPAAPPNSYSMPPNSQAPAPPPQPPATRPWMAPPPPPSAQPPWQQQSSGNSLAPPPPPPASMRPLLGAPPPPPPQ